MIGQSANLLANDFADLAVDVLGLLWWLVLCINVVALWTHGAPGTLLKVLGSGLVAVVLLIVTTKLAITLAAGGALYVAGAWLNRRRVPGRTNLDRSRAVTRAAVWGYAIVAVSFAGKRVVNVSVTSREAQRVTTVATSVLTAWRAGDVDTLRTLAWNDDLTAEEFERGIAVWRSLVRFEPPFTVDEVVWRSHTTAEVIFHADVRARQLEDPSVASLSGFIDIPRKQDTKGRRACRLFLTKRGDQWRVPL